MIAYEDELNADPRGAIAEGGMHFEGRSKVQQTLRGVAKRLDELGVPYAVAGGMALFFHGYRRFTEDVDILVTREGLKRIHEALDGLGYVPPFAGSKNLRDTVTAVRVEFIVSGEFPGDGKPKPVAFPDPADVAIEIDGIKFLNLEKLIELKLASGMSNASRLRDLADVQDLIRDLKLPEVFASRLDASVREAYRQRWTAAQGNMET